MKTIAAFLLLVPHLSRVATSNEDPIDLPCRARAWVRAPDLELGQVVQGDVKVKLDGACDNVSSFSLGLRFGERSWVKTPRDGATLPLNPEDNLGRAWSMPEQNSSKSSIYNTDDMAWFHWINPEVNQSAWDRYASDIQNPDLWLVREEERIAFETRYPLVQAVESTRDIVKSFALLVPSTVYPPAFDMSYSFGSSGGVNAADTEHSYTYFVDVIFSNGTHVEVDAGYTSFKSAVGPLSEPASGNGEGRVVLNVGRESVNVTAKSLSRQAGSDLGAKNVIPSDEFILEITFPDGRHFEPGSTNNVTIVSHQLGPGLQRPLNIRLISSHVEHKRFWAAKHAADNKSAEALLQSGMQYHLELQPKPGDKFCPGRQRKWDAVYPRFSQDGVIQNGTWFSTEAVTAQFQLLPKTYPPFEMYYQTSVVELTIDMAIRNVSDSGSGPGMPVDNEEYNWIPTLREETSYWNAESIRATVPIFVHRKPEHIATSVSRFVHYLSPEARAPVFVDPSSIAQLLQMTVEDRDSLAPFAQAKIIARTDGDVVKNRYFPWAGMGHPRYYVGDTWLRKVVAREVNRDSTHRESTFVIQA